MVHELRPPQVPDQLEPTFADPCATNFRRAGSSPREARLDAAVPQRYIFQPDLSNARISGSISARLDRMEDDEGCDGLVPLKKMAGHLPEAPSSNGASSSRGSYPPAIGQGTLQSDIDRYRPPPSHCPNRNVGESYIDMVGGSQTTRGHSAVSAIRNAGERKPLKPLNAASLDVFRAIKQRNGGGASAKMMPNPRFVGEPNESTPHTRTFGTQITPREAGNAQNVGKAGGGWLGFLDMIGCQACSDFKVFGSNCCTTGREDPGKKRILSVTNKPPAERWPMGGYEKTPCRQAPRASYQDENGDYVL